MLLGKNAEGEWYKRRLTFQRPSRLVEVEFFFFLEEDVSKLNQILDEA